MKTTRPAAGEILYRAFTPRWAAEPLSGAGAALSGGRFNRPDVPALYLSLELATAVAEYRQAAPFLPPFTLVTYRSNLPPLVDVRLLDDEWDALWPDWKEDWRALLVNGVEPPSWVLGDMVRAAGHPGMIFPSLAASGGVNIVLFADVLVLAEVLAVVDDGRLPRDGSSWEGGGPGQGRPGES